MLNSAPQSAYGLLFAWVLAEQAGLPIPAVPMLLAAGAMAANGRMHFGLALLVGLVGSMIADAAWYEAGRYRGLSLVHSICRLSLEKDSCARKTQQLYGRYGAFALVIAKLVPGLNFAAPPLSGIFQMRRWRFLVFNGAGATVREGKVRQQPSERTFMARIEDLKFTHRLFMRSYQFRRVDWSPGAHLGKPLSQAKFVLVTTAALHLPQQAAFDHGIRGGDCSFRELPGNVDVRNLEIAHRSSAFDQSGATKDRNLVFPLDRFGGLVREKQLGALNHRHFSFMGSITAPARLISETAPAVAKLLQQDQVDAAFLVPV